ncbi:cell division protein FtsA [Candidatus Chrysopegis kryptomonas]|uniref:Cell division protein FtsA n=1 Tax=Candidatus Chryseopegocella kryptomonas TaxID=1633643 RepID=A0A0P1MRD5_9BACT|nr:cell division protein FtsA [Candidatus Chrysopegis kryptomonas]CUS98489.1 cell division protein FtsA [Candidatus Chrysopegis kryptomonas]
MSEIIVGLDVGTSKICALVASLEDNGKANILGLAKVPSEGLLLEGNVVNIERTAESIRKVINMVENQSGEKVKSVVVGIASGDLRGMESVSVIATRPPKHIITQDDVVRLVNEARNIRHSSDTEIIHVLPQEFKVDGVKIEKSQDLIGMVGIKVEARVHIILAKLSAVENLRQAVMRAGYEVEDFVSEPLASSYAVLDPEEKEIGVVLIDIGAGTADISIFEDNVLKYTGSLPIAGNQITMDIRKAFTIPKELAEKLKITEGYAYLNEIMEDKIITVQGVGGRGPFEITRSMLCRVIQPRVEEIFELLYKEHLREYVRSQNLSAGIVLTGGTSLLKGIDKLVEDKFEMPVRVGIPSRSKFSGGLVNEIENPIYSTVVGLVLYKIDEIQKSRERSGRGLSDAVRKLMEFFKTIFH